MWARRPRAEVDLEALYRAHFGLVWALVGRYGVRPSHREDVVQEVWLTVHRRLASFDPSLSAAAHWIAGVTRFVAWRHIRTMMRAHRKLEALQALARVDDDPIVDHETVAFVGAALDSLEPIFRDAITSVELEGWSGPEAAERLGLPVNTLYSRLRIAKRRLRETLIELEAVERPRECVPADVAARTWAAIVPVVAPFAKASVLGSFGAWLLVPAAAVVGLGLVAVVPTARVEETPPFATSVAAPEPPPAAARETIAQAPVVTPQPVAIDEVERPEPPVLRASAAVVPDRAPSPARTEAGDEAAILADALAAIERKDAKAALARLREHETRFADGALALERRAARVRALCLAGHTAQARGEAKLLLRDHPEAAAAIAVRDACAP
jgi:RNA polymerase sigma factor (sigma-70 family)